MTANTPKQIVDRQNRIAQHGEELVAALKDCADFMAICASHGVVPSINEYCLVRAVELLAKVDAP